MGGELGAESGEFIFVVCPAVDGGGGLGVEEADLGLEVVDFVVGV